MATSLTDVLAALQNAVQAINNLNTTIGQTFPGLTVPSSTVPSAAGGLTFSSSQPQAFFTVVSSSGASYKIAGY